ncbi:MAG: pyridoxal phosphate-dependent aminotransferase [Proteobacteria bacterium]|nr:pyridoxal phosphate-dependent aminotransferase [Pseudomonadota bacterium]MBU1389947.1 pyridoxal phosphate-dependent aminotransferase [Pseudomonadota bacterium]MBU1542546.1 pyridoxal phosphate-dependent aminotransferase [Pseudomonadota bacterium]MBU2479715.1 pyridoxal phosphate-dependent aminotransferase [Pseudomonadota bacterium]
MPIAQKMVQMVKSASMIRKMFEEGIQMKEKYGADNVFDFSLGNPDVPPPLKVKETLLELIHDKNTSHGYMPNTGFPQVRKAVADYLNKEFNVGLTPELVVMTVGAAGALNDTIRALVNPGEEILVPAPYFVGYHQYAFIGGADLKPVGSLPDFHLDLDAIKAGINEKTRIMLINSPNNPTGVVYTPKELYALGQLLVEASNKFGKRIYLVSDEPYRKIAYDVDVPSVFAVYPHTIVLTSYSKELSLAGERIGYLAIHPDAEDAALIAGAAGVANTMMYVNAPSLFQQVVGKLQGITVDVGIYKKRRDILCEGLQAAGYEFDVPQGAFYLFPKSPIANDLEFVDILKQYRILSVPGTGFGGPGFFRLSYAVPEKTITGSFDGFKKAIDSVK